MVQYFALFARMTLKNHTIEISSRIRQLLELWNANYKELRMVDTKQFQNMKDPMELSRFQHICMNHIEAAKEKLLKQ